VDALGGAPGILSARYAGSCADDASNNARLLAELDAVPDAGRGARYRCAMVYLRGPLDASPVICQASWEGRIARLPRGSGGFGYDPLFLVGEGQTTAAELDPERKNRESHRGQALRALVATLTSGSAPA
jgi:XTP/dITP diphosphohydrolase